MLVRPPVRALALGVAVAHHTALEALGERAKRLLLDGARGAHARLEHSLDRREKNLGAWVTETTGGAHTIVACEEANVDIIIIHRIAGTGASCSCICPYAW